MFESTKYLWFAQFFQTGVLHNLRALLNIGTAKARKIVTPNKGELTIASGEITVTGSYHSVDTESDASTDNLDTINGGEDGMHLWLRAANNGRTVTLRDDNGNLHLTGGNFSLTHRQDLIYLFFDKDIDGWQEVSRSDNAT